MIPIKLSIEGLYSYQKRQTINFDQLTDAGLFGIFGAVGSGKSSILEAITFALYGETERINSKEKRAYNMMNLKSDKSHLELEFCNYNNEIYRVVRSFRRNSKKFDDVKPSDYIFYHYINQNWKPLENTNAEEIIGLSYANFKRTIIIPQGQFKEFLELGATDRTKMMKDIFKLHRYDLQDKTSILLKENESALNQILGKLSGFEDVSLEVINTLQHQLDTEKKEFLIAQKKFDEAHSIFQQLNNLKEDYQKLNLKKAEFEKAKADKITIDAEAKKLKQYESYYHNFNQPLKELAGIDAQLFQKEDNLTLQKKELDTTTKQLVAVNAALIPLQNQIDTLSNDRLRINDLELIVKILDSEIEITELRSRTINGKSKVKEVEKEKNDINEELKKLEIEVDDLSKSKLNSELLYQVGQWFLMNDNFINKEKEQKEKHINLQNSINERLGNFDQAKVNRSTYNEDFSHKIKQIIEFKKDLEKQLTQLQLQQQLAHYADNLHDDTACPLCGSLHHPNITTLDDVTDKINAIIAAIKDQDELEKSANTNYNNLKNWDKEIVFYEEQLHTETEALKTLQNDIFNHHKAFIWDNFNANDQSDFEKKKTQNIILESKITSLNKTIVQKRQLAEDTNNQLIKFEKALTKLKLEELEKQTQIQQNISNLKLLNYIDYKNLSKISITDELFALTKAIQHTEENYAKYQEKQQQLLLAEASQKSTLSLLDKDIKQLIVNRDQLKTSINNLLKTLEIESLEIVKSILSTNLNTTLFNEKINAFEVNFQTLSNIIKDLELKFETQDYDESKYQNQYELLEIAKSQLKESNDNVVKTSTELQRLQKAYNDKKELLLELDKIQNRGQNLKTLFNLFKGAGFVQYASSIYLRQLCDHANQRFHRMTRNQLSLKLNDQNDFEIIDYLNEGRSRSVKTLSGGQAFQVSLCLALALAESVQTNAKADKNFFFIDEGFGTQDADSINIVFETLQSLQKENRIVGIISHIEELKEKMPRAIQVTKDQEQGSIIQII